MTVVEGHGQDSGAQDSFEARLAAVATEFVTSLPDRVRNVSKSIAAGDVEAADDELHKLVGGGGTYGHMAVSMLASETLVLVRRGTLAAASAKALELLRLAEEIQPKASC